MNAKACRQLVPTLLAIFGVAVVSPATPAQNLDRQSCELAIQKTVDKMARGVEQGPFEADWNSLERHTAAPEWFRDAKLGIYFHWGVYSVPAHGNEWYPKWMHTRDGRRSYYRHHVENWGEPDEFGYHDFVPKFTAEHFDATEWAELFAKAGARYAGPVCEHHDGYSMWDSELTPWNSADTGPGRDITGELAVAIREQGMRFVTTFHHERTRTWYPRVEGWPTTSDDPELQLLYMNVPEELFYRIFATKLGEVIDRYQPDLIWFDGQMTQIPDSYHRQFLAYYFNQAARWGRDVVVTTKKRQYPPEVSVEDFEKGRTNHLTDYCWLTDDTISMGSWCYTKDLKIKSTTRVIHDFIDIVSKNGCLLLNISPKSDGTIPDDQREVLLGLGAWLETNGEAIYDTRPWLAFGEGPTRLRKSGGFVGTVAYTPADIRYTRRKDGGAVYATALGWPNDRRVILSAVSVDGGEGRGRVELLGHDEVLSYRVDDHRRLVIELPDEEPCQHAFAFKLSGFDLSLNAAAAITTPDRPQVSKDLTLAAAEAKLTGPKLEQKIPGAKNIGHWASSQGRAEWRVEVPAAGKYRLTAIIATRSTSRLTVEIGGQKATADVPNTGAWDRRREIEIGTIELSKPGVHEVTARPANSGGWNAVNLWELRLIRAQ